MLDSMLTSAVDFLRQRTAFPGWTVELMVFLAIFTLARFAAAVWNDTILGGEPLWVAYWAAYDNLSAYAEDSIILALIATIVTEVSIMVLARKRIRIEREEGRKEGKEEGREEVRAELEPVIKDLQERIRQLENGGSEAEPEGARGP